MVRPPREGLSQLYQDLRQRSSEPVDVRLGVERPRTDPDGAVGEGAQGAVDVGGTVQPRADGDLERLVEDAADLRRRKRFATEAERADAARGVAVAEDFIAADLLQPLPQPLAQRDFVG